MLGKPGMTRPVKSWYCAAEWTTISAWHDLMTARSSARCARYGKRSETSSPLFPYRWNVRFVPSSRASGLMNWYLASPKEAGRFSPCSLLRSGFGSKLSIWLGPPLR